MRKRSNYEIMLDAFGNIKGYRATSALPNGDNIVPPNHPTIKYFESHPERRKWKDPDGNYEFLWKGKRRAGNPKFKAENKRDGLADLIKERLGDLILEAVESNDFASTLTKQVRALRERN